MAFKIEKSEILSNNKNSQKGIEDFLQKEIVFFGSKFNNKKKQIFYQELSILLNAGITIKEGLTLIIDSFKKSGEKVIFTEVLENVINGKQFSEALMGTGLFSDYEYYSLKIGEETGTTAKVCAELASFFNKKNEQRRIVIAALTYPSIVLSTAIFVVIFMLSYVVPMFEGIFKQNGMELPYITKLIIKSSNFLKSYGLFILLLCFILILAGRFLRNNRRYKTVLHSLLLKIPILGPFIKKIYLTQFSQAIALLTTAKVPMLSSIQLVKKMIEFVPLQNALSAVEKDILLGKSLSQSLKDNAMFDNRFISLIKVAEETNQTEYVFKQLNEQYSNEVLEQSKVMTTVLEPLIILVVGFIVAVLLIAMYLPMFQMSSAIG